VFENLIIVGSATNRLRFRPGDVRAFDVRTESLRALHDSASR
jgi:hypothetical protein